MIQTEFDFVSTELLGDKMIRKNGSGLPYWIFYKCAKCGYEAFPTRVKHLTCPECEYKHVGIIDAT